MDTMDKMIPVSSGKSETLFKVLIIGAVIILFIIVLYMMFGPLPNQKNFVTKGGNNSGVLNQLQVNGISSLNGDVEANQDLTVLGNEKVGGVLTAGTTQFVTTVGGADTLQGKIVPTLIGFDLQGKTIINIRDNTTNPQTTVEFKTGPKQTTFFGKVNVNGTAGLSVLNDTLGNIAYNITNNPTTNNLLIKANTKTILDADQTGDTITLFDSSSNPPTLNINGPSGLGRVFDTKYNQPPTLNANPSFDTLNVIGNTTLGGATTLNGTLTAKENVTLDSADLIMNTSGNNIRFTDTTSGASNSVQFAGSGQEIQGNANGDIYLKTNTNVYIRNSAGSSGIAKFDTRPIGSGTSDRNAFLEPFINIDQGYLKISLPRYGTTPVAGPAGNPPINSQVNSFTYTSNDLELKTGTGVFSTGTYVGLWNTTQGSYAQGLMQTSGTLTKCIWYPPKKGIWSIQFNSYSTLGTNPNLVIGNVAITSENTPRKAFGVNYVNTFVVLNTTDRIVVTADTGSGYISSSPAPTLTFNLIMELN